LVRKKNDGKREILDNDERTNKVSLELLEKNKLGRKNYRELMTICRWRIK